MNPRRRCCARTMCCVRASLGMASVAIVVGLVVACVDFEGRTHGPHVQPSPSSSTATPIFGQGGTGGSGGDGGASVDAASCGDDCGCLAQCCDELGPPIGNGDPCGVARDRWSLAWCARAYADYVSRGWCE